MAARTRAKAEERIDQLMERASDALSRTEHFACERDAEEALRLAARRGDYDRMARILMPLEEARRQKRLAAADDGRIHVVEQDPPRSKEVLEPGCWLVQPPLVGADGRDLRDLADKCEVPTIVIVREPLTRTKEWPIVMVGPVTVRTRVEPVEELSVDWFLDAAEALGEQAIEDVEGSLAAETRVDRLLDRLLTLRDDDRLHQALCQACRDALHEADASGGHRGGRAKQSHAAEEADDEDEDEAEDLDPAD